MAVADLNGDGIPDFVVSQRRQRQRERAAGQWQWDVPDAADLCSRRQHSASVAVADLNGDGIADLVVSS